MLRPPSVPSRDDVVTLTPDDLRAKIAESKKPKNSKPKRQPATRDKLAIGLVLAYDQTLTNTGFAFIDNNEDHLLVQTEMFTQSTNEASHMGSIDKFLKLHKALQNRSWPTNLETVFEMPAVQGYRIESSLMAAAAICLVHPYARPISNQHAKSIIVANHMATKAQVGAVINGLVDDHIGPWNEHTRDAVMLGLAYLYDLKKEQS